MAQVSYGTITITDTNDIESIIVEYNRNQSTSSPPDQNDSGWSTNRPAWAQGYYIWQRTRIHKSGTQASADTFGTAVCLTGSTGQPGATGKGITGIETLYATNNSTTTAPTSGWQSQPPTYSSSNPKYWVKVTTTYNSGDPDVVTYLDNGITDAMATAAAANTTANQANQTANSANQSATNAYNIATGINQHFWSIESDYATGIPAGSYITDTAIDTFKSQKTGGNLLTRSDGIWIRDGIKTLASLTGTALTFYNPSLSTKGIELDSSALKFYDANENMIASYGNKIVLGKKTSSASTFSRAEFEFNSMKLYAKGDSDPYFWVEDKRNENGVATIIESFSVNTEDTEFNIIQLNYALKTFVAVYVDNNDITQVSAYGLYQDSKYKVQFDPSLFSEGTTHTISIEYTTEDAVASMTFGSRNSSSYGPYSFSEGQFNIASGVCSHAEGSHTTASGSRSHAEGLSTTASGNMSHTEGAKTTASGHTSHAEGLQTTASKDCSHAEGFNTTASGIQSHAEGNDTVASGYYSHAEGNNTVASGIGSHAQNYYTIAQGMYQTVIGRSNIAQGSNNSFQKTDYAFIIGNGSPITSSNAFAVDWNGNAYCFPKTINLGTYIASGILTNSGGELMFSIPLGRVLPSNASISKITFSIVARVANANGTGYYCIKGTSGGTGTIAFDSSASKTFYDAGNTSRTLTDTMWNKSIQGGTNIYIDWNSGTNYFFSGTSTINNYINNNPVVIYLNNIEISLSYS